MKDSIIVFCDGGSRGNPGEAAYGFVVYNSAKKILHKEGKKIGVQTNNFAEYTAVIKALQWLLKNTGEKSQIQFFLDSKLVVEQVSGNWKIKSESIRALYHTVKTLERNLGTSISYKHVPRSQNTEADLMVNLSLDAKM